MSPRRQRLLCAGVVVLFLALALARDPVQARWVDFPVYFEAGAKALDHRTVYDVVGHWQFKYSPFVALVMGACFSSFEFGTVSRVYYGLATLLLVGVFAAFARAESRERFWPFLAVLVGFFCNALLLELALGQVNGLVWALLYGVFTLSDRPSSEGRQGWGRTLGIGACLALAVQLKLYACLAGPWLLFRREWRALAATAAFSLVTTPGLVAAYHGWAFASEESVRWLQSLLASSTELLVSRQNISLLGLVMKATGSGPVAYLIWALGVLTWLVALWRASRWPGRGWGQAIVGVGIVALNPLSWSYWVFFSAPLLLKVAGNFSTFRAPLSWVGAVVVLVLFNMQHAWVAWNGGLMLGLLVLIGAAAVLVKRVPLGQGCAPGASLNQTG